MLIKMVIFQKMN